MAIIEIDKERVKIYLAYLITITNYYQVLNDIKHNFIYGFVLDFKPAFAYYC